jgi:hypothetical protein
LASPPPPAGRPSIRCDKTEVVGWPSGRLSPPPTWSPPWSRFNESDPAVIYRRHSSVNVKIGVVILGMELKPRSVRETAISRDNERDRMIRKGSGAEDKKLSSVLLLCHLIKSNLPITHTYLSLSNMFCLQLLNILSKVCLKTYFEVGMENVNNRHLDPILPNTISQFYTYL